MVNMGIQDRDYYWKKRSDSNPLPAKPLSQTKPKVKYLLFPLITMVILWFNLDVYLKKKISGNITIFERPPFLHKNSASLKPAQKIISLKADRQGHFRGKLLINNVLMPFLIDTGATMTVIPAKLAVIAKLPVGKRVKTNTAGGKVFANKTRINSLKIGNVKIRNLEAQINKHLFEVLVGMNTLKYFKMTSNGKTLILTPNSYEVKNITTYANKLVLQQPVKKTSIKKTVTCNEQNVCRTSYSNY